VSEEIWLVTFMDYDLGYFDQETCRLGRNSYRRLAWSAADLVNDRTRQKCYPCLRYKP
jgi:hypothetical protein